MIEYHTEQKQIIINLLQNEYINYSDLFFLSLYILYYTLSKI